MYHLGTAGFDLKLVSSVTLARTREALHNSWDKNDPNDAQVILHMLQIGAVQIFQDPMVAGTNDIQELSKTRYAVSRSKTELWHRILAHYFPEADRFHRSSRTDWFLALREMFPSPHMISALRQRSGPPSFSSEAAAVGGMAAAHFVGMVTAPDSESASSARSPEPSRPSVENLFSGLDFSARR